MNAAEVVAKAEERVAGPMPAWWPSDRPAQVLRAGMMYRDKAGKWRDHDGVIVSRAARRASEAGK